MCSLCLRYWFNGTHLRIHTSCSAGGTSAPRALHVRLDTQVHVPAHLEMMLVRRGAGRTARAQSGRRPHRQASPPARRAGRLSRSSETSPRKVVAAVHVVTTPAMTIHRAVSRTAS